MKTFSGKALFIDRSDINTDEIIPAKYLTEISKDALKPYLLEDLVLDGFSTDKLDGISVIVSRENFGCGSSREHAPWALEVNGINCVIAPNFARIFRQNMFNCGMCAIELDEEKVSYMFQKYSGKDVNISVNFDSNNLVINEGDEKIPFTISDYDRALVKSGGWVEYADKNY